MLSKESDKFVNSNILEGMISFKSLISARESNLNNRTIERVLFDKDKVKSKSRELSYIKSKSKCHNFTVELVSSDIINECTIGNTHGGIVVICGERSFKFFDISDIIINGFYVMLDGVEDPYNFGYTLRSLYAAGVNGIILAPRNWMSASGVVCRSSAGASELFQIYISESVDAIEIFKSVGYRVIVADKDNSISMYDANLKKPLLLIVGGEKRGTSRAILDKADSIIGLEYGRNFEAALSTASAATILSYEVFRQNRN